MMTLTDTPLGTVAREGSFIRFTALPPNPKTPRFGVTTKDPPVEHLGVVSWSGRWWCFIFSPAPETFFESTCLREIAQFLDDLKAERKR